jgi:uncharacterized protein YyaL (SSP411 family)
MGVGLLMGNLALPAMAAHYCCKTKSAASVQWVKGYEKGLAQAKGQHKLAVIDFFSHSCPWCDEMDRKTFTDPSIVKLSKRFVMVKVDATRERRPSIRLAIRGYPTVLLMDGKGNEITRVVGYRDAGDLASELKEAMSKAGVSRETASR